MKKKYFIVRTEQAGMFFGQIKKRTGTDVVMTDCRRLWYWDGAASSSQLAIDGVSKPENCKFPEALKENLLFGAKEITPCTEKSVASIKGVPVWRQ